MDDFTLRSGLLFMAAGALLALAGCATVADSGPVADQSPPPQAQVIPAGYAPTNGAIWQAPLAASLFEDVKARKVGDIVTIRLAERTQASKSASTDATKESTVDTGFPVLLGSDVTRNGDQILNNQWETSQEFAGRGSSSQSNRLDGSIAVTVTEVLPNGYLRVEGEKWLTLNQGEELIRINGIIRSSDIGADNSVSSLKVADARITYKGKGLLADANSPGFLTRFFMKLWPL